MALDMDAVAQTFTKINEIVAPATAVKTMTEPKKRPGSAASKKPAAKAKLSPWATVGEPRPSPAASSSSAMFATPRTPSPEEEESEEAEDEESEEAEEEV